MNTKQALKIYKKQIEKIKAYTLVLDTTSFDRLTIAPKDGSTYRNKMISIINGELFELQTDKEFVEAVLYLSSQDLGEVMNREIALAKKAMEDQLKFTKEEAMTFSMALMEGNDAWRKAKSASKYALFEKQLLKLIDLSKQRAAKRDPKKKAYDLLLVPADSFGTPGFVRIAYCVSTDTIRRSLPAFKKLAQSYGLC